jgi:hypothetical protein
MTTFKVKDCELYRKSENKVFTHAVIFRNVSGGSVSPEPAATFHVSLKLAEKEMQRMAKIDWLEPVTIAEVEVA